MNERPDERAVDNPPVKDGAGRRPWFPPVLEDLELGLEVTAYSGRA